MVRRTMPPRNTEGYQMHTPVADVVARTVMTAAGAAAIGFGAFLEWFRPTLLGGTDLSWRALYLPKALAETAPILRSVGGVMLGLAVLALIGVTLRSGWLTRIAGALALLGVGAYGVTLARSGANFGEAFGYGAWVTLAGSLVTIIGGTIHSMRYTLILPANETTTRADGMATGDADATQCHVQPNGSGAWDVIGPGSGRDTATFTTKEEAERHARALLAAEGGGELVIHKRNGKIRERDRVVAA